jgi:hypothetical protein
MENQLAGFFLTRKLLLRSMEAKLGTMKTLMERNGILFFGNLHVLVSSFLRVNPVRAKQPFTGEEGEEPSSPVSDATGTLEIVIRDVTDGDMDDILPSKERAASEGAEHEGYKCAQALHENLQDNHNVFTDWREPKPRHTHHAE